MSVNTRVRNLVNVGKRLQEKNDNYQNIVRQAIIHNKWFTEETISLSIDNITKYYLSETELQRWIEKYNIPDRKSEKNLGIITAGNIPLVGIHDIITGYICGFPMHIKVSSKDTLLTTYFVDLLLTEDDTADIQIVDKLTDHNLVITTSSNSVGVHFEYYFRNIPHIIRKNRNSIAILHDKITDDDIRQLSNDIFSYYGLGCRNVSSVLVPRSFDFSKFMEILHERKELILHNKYKNNFDYNLAIFSMNGDNFYSNGCLILRENENIASRIASLNFQYYDNEADIINVIQNNKDKIQCVSSALSIEGIDTIEFGKLQAPSLWDYADGEDTVTFLLENR